MLALLTLLALPANAAGQTSDAARGLLVAAIDRGAPLYNMGSVEGCAAVYEIAAASLVRFGDDELSETDLGRLRTTLATLPRDADGRAWALRRAFDAVLEGRPSGRSLDGDVVVDVRETAEDWREVDDGVMGGVSRGGMARTRDGVRWTGELSAENNGGFVSTRLAFDPVDLSERSGLRVRVKGDGRTYRLTVNTTGRNMGGVGYAQLQTTGSWQTLDLPWSVFTGRAYGGTIPLDATAVGSVQLVLSGKDQLGDFRLDLASIEAL